MAGKGSRFIPQIQVTGQAAPAPSPTPAPSAGMPNDRLLDELTKAIYDAMFGQNQPMPPRYQPATLSPAQGYAIARNPQLGSLINQQAQAPGQALYQQQVDAFTNAMDMRKFGIQQGVSLANTQQRVSAMGRPLRFVNGTTVDEMGQSVDYTDVYDARTAEYLGRQDRGQHAYSPQILPGIPGNMPPQMVNRNAPGGQATNIPGASIPPAPPSVSEDWRKNQAYLSGVQSLRQAFRTLKQKTQGSNVLGRVYGQEAGESKYGGILAPVYNAFESQLRSTLNTMIVAITGLSFPEAAFKRYRSELPLATDTEDQAMAKIDNVLRRVISEQQTIGNQYPAVGGAPMGGETREQMRQRLLQKHGGTP